ncbi:hypothetical protein PC114_g21586 [Phytophthora cactorum]|uniref:Uncharacterized protein n=1 Tax=Phytophthora cactorum TaxID=29920 RepID=A0A8T1AZ75_9STRA|nr:hypothetical protein PC114_g21586 [Phytophthora cactorum]KAG2891261.1 hypothetical protein PC115_g19252 [Phytophthora cactorum]
MADLVTEPLPQTEHTIEKTEEMNGVKRCQWLCKVCSAYARAGPLLRKGAYRGQKVTVGADGLVYVVTKDGDRIILPAVYWALAFKEAHDSIWACHLRGPPTYERLSHMK